jgi:hypothetical protein
VPLTREHQRMLRLPSPITKEDFQRIKLKILSKKLKDSKIKMKKLERE